VITCAKEVANVSSFAPRIDPSLLHRAADGVSLDRTALGAKLGASRRTVTRWLSARAFPSSAQLLELVRLLQAAGNTTLAAELSAACGVPIDEPPAQASAVFVDAIVCAAADAAGLAPSMVRPILLAAFERTAMLGLGAEEVAAALRPPAPVKRSSRSA
jgi:hypothetical protein